ncbi:MAG: peptidylprolyl isomerase [Ruminococcus sp.]|nr:peptidylprolyl isomerase [Ruminococcus sp.]
MILSKFLKKSIACFLCAAMSAAVLSGCGKEEAGPLGSTMYKSGSAAEDYEICLDSESGYTDMVNYTLPQKGEEIIKMTIRGKGTIRIKLFPELMPRACANFVGLASQGYYDGLTFHRIIADFMIQGGDPEGNGRGGESIWGTKFDGGASKYLYHVNGALAYANSSGTSTDGSQFYIVVGQKFPEEVIDDYASAELTDKARQAYIENGGAPWLDGGYTIFGQVFDGMSIVEDICNNTEVVSEKPVEDVIIDKVEVVTYEG